MNQSQFEKWSKTRRIGRNRFILIYGVLIWGITVAIFWSVIMNYLMGWSFIPLLLGALVVFPVGGYFFGSAVWNQGESRFERFQSDASTNSV